MIATSQLALGGLIGFVLLAQPASTARAQELPRAKAQAPENHVLLNNTTSGRYFIAKPLKEEYDRLLGRLRVLRSDIDAGRTTGAEALRELDDLQTQLEALRLQIEEKKVLVPIAQEHKEVETISFELGSERCLVIEANDVRVVGWDQPGVKCELEKTVLTADGKLDEADLKGIKLIHKHGRFREKVGWTQAESDAEEERLMASEAGKALLPEALAKRKKLRESIRASWEHMRDFQGKDIDLIEIEGITYQQGNRQMTLEVSYGKGRSMGFEWRRHAKLTVYVPSCKALAVRTGGGTSLISIDVQNVKGSVVVWSSGTPVSGHSGAFQVRGVEGSLVVGQVPLKLIEDVSGNVTITATSELSGHSTRVGGDGRMTYAGPPLACSCKNIRGDLVAWFARSDLQVERVGGRIDVRNEFGDTKLLVDKALSHAAHRVVSESGRVEVILSRGAWGDLPLFAVTQSGNVRTNTQRDFLEDFNVGSADNEGARRKYVGLKRSPPGPVGPPRMNPQELLNLAGRFGKTLSGEERPAGLDVLSRGGTVIIQVNQ